MIERQTIRRSGEDRRGEDRRQAARRQDQRRSASIRQVVRVFRPGFNPAKRTATIRSCPGMSP